MGNPACCRLQDHPTYHALHSRMHATGRRCVYDACSATHVAMVWCLLSESVLMSCAAGYSMSYVDPYAALRSNRAATSDPKESKFLLLMSGGSLP